MSGPAGHQAPRGKDGEPPQAAGQTEKARTGATTPDWAHRPLSRRALLARLAMGSAAAGAAAVLGAAVVEEVSERSTPRPPSSSAYGAGLPELGAAATTTTSGPTQVFRSRPDLRPPTITVDVKSGALGGDLVLTDSHSGPAQQGPMIIDGAGELVWFLPLSSGNDAALRAFNLRCWSYKEKQVLSWFQGAVVNAHGQGHYVLLDSTYKKIAEVHAKNGFQGDLHEFVITPQGTALFTCYGQKAADLSRYGGPGPAATFLGSCKRSS